jgi:type II secretory pathway component PulF
MAAAAAVQRGEPVGPILAGQRDVPTVFAEFYRSGEMTGKLDEVLQAVQRSCSDTAATKLKIAGIVYPALLFGAVAVWAAVKIVLFYAGHFSQFEKMME